MADFNELARQCRQRFIAYGITNVPITVRKMLGKRLCNAIREYSSETSSPELTEDEDFPVTLYHRDFPYGPPRPQQPVAIRPVNDAPPLHALLRRQRLRAFEERTIEFLWRSYGCVIAVFLLVILAITFYVFFFIDV